MVSASFSRLAVLMSLHVHSVYMDSRNYQLLNLRDEAELEKMINEYLDKHPIVSGDPARRPSREERYSLHMQSLKDTGFAVNLLHDCLLDRTSLSSIVIELSVDGFLESYEGQVGEGAAARRIEEWLQDYYPVPIIRSQIVEQIEGLGAARLSDRVKRRLLEWAAAVKAATQDEVGERTARLMPLIGKIEELLNP